ncbi:MAG: hypothetical protein ABR881_19825 [Candidatus Sulfotelmatobacter sp.]|jgi:hypothetical protein
MSVIGAENVVTEPTAYYPYTQVPDSMRALLEANMAIAVRTRLQQNELLHSINAAVAGVNAQVPVYDVKTMESMVADSDSLRNFDLLLLGGFSLLALGGRRCRRACGHGIFGLAAHARDRHSYSPWRARAMSCASFFARARGWQSSGR